MSAEPTYPFGRPAGRISATVGIKDPGVAALVRIDRFGVEDAAGEHYLTPAALASYRAMRAAAQAAGLGRYALEIASSYRSDEKQARLFEAAVKKYGSPEAARKWVAPPGKSAHCTGACVDFYLGISNSSASARNGEFKMITAWKWLRDNAPLFGWNPYEAEPWHWEHCVIPGSATP